MTSGMHFCIWTLCPLLDLHNIGQLVCPPPAAYVQGSPEFKIQRNINNIRNIKKDIVQLVCPPRPPAPAYICSRITKVQNCLKGISPHTQLNKIIFWQMREGVNWWERVKNWPQRDVDSGGGLCHTMVLQPFYPTLFYTDSYPFPLNVSALLCYDTPLLHPFHISQNMALLLYPASF